MKKILVTGGSGFIGRHCLPLLAEKGYEVHVIDINKKVKMGHVKKIHWHIMDVLDAKKTGRLISKVRPAYLLHFAWYTQHEKYWTAPENFRWVEASMSLLEKFHSAGGKRAVIAGTCAEYEWKDGRCSESRTPLLPATLYGTCRHALQIMADAFAKNSGLSYAWGRIFFVYGPYENQKRLVPMVIRSLLIGEDIDCSHGNQKRDFLYVEDVAAAFVALLESDTRGPVNIGSGLAVSIKEIIDKITKKTGRASLVHFGQKPVSAGEPPLLVADVRRLKEEVMWTPFVGLDKGLDMTVRWWRDHINKE